MPAPSTCTISGTLYGPDATAVSGAVVKVYVTTGFTDGSGNYIPAGLYASTTTDASGAWSIAVIRTQALSRSVTFQFEYPLGNNQSQVVRYAAVIPTSGATANFSDLVNIGSGTATLAASPTTDSLTEGTTNLYFTQARAIASPITGFTSGAGTLAATDTLLQAIQKLDGNIAGKQAAGSYLTASNNLSDVGTPATAFNNISGLSALGDLIYGGASGARAKLSGNTAAAKKFLTQTGDGVNSAAPAWGALAAADLPVMVGDSGTGGTQGAVPAPVAGDAAAGKVLKADGTWATVPVTSNLTTKGDLYVYSTTNTRLGVGTNDQLLVPDSTQTTGLRWTSTLPTAAMPALTGDVTNSAGSLSTTIANAAVTNAKLATMAASTIKGNNTGVAAAPSDLTATQATALLNAFTGDSGSGGVKGLVPAPAAGDTAAGKFLKANGTWTTPPAAAATNSFIRKAGPTGYGSAPTAIVIFGTSTASNGTDVTYATDSVNGDTFTINTAGIYSVVVDLAKSAAGNMSAGISVNATGHLATSISALTYAQGMRSWAEIGNAGFSPAVWIGYLAVNDVVRAHTDGTALASDTNSYIEITRIL